MSLYLGIRPSNTPYNVAQFKKSFECCNYITAAQAPETVRALCMQRHPAMSTLQFGPAGCRQGRGKLRPPIERIGPLAGFGLDKLPDDRDPLGFAEACHGCPLRLDPEPGAVLLLCGDSQVGDGFPHTNCIPPFTVCMKYEVHMPRDASFQRSPQSRSILRSAAPGAWPSYCKRYTRITRCGTGSTFNARGHLEREG
jgi:hypothetical protein